jgi:hypothetical protein
MSITSVAARKQAWRKAAACWRAIVVLCALGSSGGSIANASTMGLPVSAPFAAATQPAGGASLESAASKAGSLGRNVAMSLIGLGFAVAAIRLVFRRSFKEAAGVLVVGLLAIALATPAGVNVLHNTVNTLFGAA